MFRLFVMEIVFAILVSVTAIMSKFLFAQLTKCLMSSKFLLREHHLYEIRKVSCSYLLFLDSEVHQYHSI